MSFAGTESHPGKYIQTNKERYSLLGEVCPHCEAKNFPPGGLDKCCGSDSKGLYQLEVIEGRAVPIDAPLEAFPVVALVILSE